MKFISVVFHPLLLATHLTGLILFIAPELLPRIHTEVRLDFLFLVFLITGFLPAFSVFLLRKFKYISDLELMKRSERVIPFFFILFYYVMASYLFYTKLDIGFLFNLVISSVTFLILILILITIKFKISVHSAAIWSSVGYLTAFFIISPITNLGLLFAAILCAGLTSTSRLYLGYHNAGQVWAGAVLGLFYSLIVTLVFA